MSLHDGFEAFPFEPWPRHRSLVKQHFPNILRESIPVPDAEMEDFMPPKEEAFEAQGRENMVQARHPLRHPHIIPVLRFEQELEEYPGGSLRENASTSSETPIRWDAQ